MIGAFALRRDAGHDSLDPVNGVARVVLHDREIPGAPLRAEDLEPVTNAELHRVLGRDVEEIDLVQHFTQTPAERHPELAMKSRLELIRVDQENTLLLGA